MDFVIDWTAETNAEEHIPNMNEQTHPNRFSVARNMNQHIIIEKDTTQERRAPLIPMNSRIHVDVLVVGKRKVM